jgi:hypothetical protein
VLQLLHKYLKLWYTWLKSIEEVINMTNKYESDELVTVQVPRSLLSDVYGFIASRTAGDGAVAEEEQVEAAAKKVELDRDLVRRMYNESGDAHRKLMEYLAATPDTWQYSSEVAKGLGLPHGAKSLAGMLGAFGRRASHRYGENKPWVSEWDIAQSESRHQMPGWVAETINSI